MQVSAAAENAYIAITSDDYSSGGTLSVWIQDRAEFELTANTGIGIQVGDGTNRIAYAVGGSDGTAFRHDTGPVKWACFLLDIANKPANFVTLAGSEANLDEAAITQVGVYFETTVKSVGGADNCFWDVIRFADNGDDVVMQGGTTSGAAGNGSEAAVVDRSTGNQQAYGVIRQLAVGVYGIQGNITIGNAASSSDQYWEETNATYAWEDRGLSSNNYYRFALIGSSTATNCEASFTACTFVVPSAASASFDGNGADLTVCTITDSTFIGFDQGIETSDDTGDDWTGNTYIDSGQVVANGCDLSGSSFSGYTGAANTSALAYNLGVDPDGELDNLTFVMPATATHAIEFGAGIPSEITLRGCDFTGYSASQDNNASIFHFLDTSGTITINLVGCTSDVAFATSYRTAGATIVVVQDPVTTTVTTVRTNGTVISGAYVHLIAAASSPEGPLPVAESVTITRAGSPVLATVTHNGHGIPDGKKVLIKGANEWQYNGVHTITDIDGNSYTYPLPEDPGGNATGTITATGVVLDGTTDGSGVISDTRTWAGDQLVSGWARKSTSSPFFKEGPINATVTAASGANISAVMTLDE